MLICLTVNLQYIIFSEYNSHLSVKKLLDDLSYLYIKYVLVTLLIYFLFSQIYLAIVPILDE